MTNFCGTQKEILFFNMFTLLFSFYKTIIASEGQVVWTFTFWSLIAPDHHMFLLYGKARTKKSKVLMTDFLILGGLFHLIFYNMVSCSVNKHPHQWLSARHGHQ